MCVLLAIASLMAACAGCDESGESAADRVVNLFGEPGLGNGQFSYPRALAISPVDGNVFVCDKTARIQRFDPNGRFEHVWRMPAWEFGKPTGMACDAQGRLWVADTHYARVICYDAEGREQFRFGSRGEGPGEFIFPTNVGWDAAGNIYVAEYGGNDRISRFSADRTFVSSFGGRDSGTASLLRPTQVKWDPRGFLWVADGCNHRVCRFSPDGRLLAAFGRAGAGPGELSYPYDLELLPATGHVLVTEFGNNRVSEFDAEGRFVRTWGVPGRRRGELQQPWKAVIGRNGLLYVLDSWNNRVQVLTW